MNALTTPSIGAADLQKLLSDVDRAALLVPPRLVRRVIKQDRDIGGVGLQVPHRKTYTISREKLRAIADHDDLGRTDIQQLPAQLILLACPEDWLSRRTREQALARFWRLLFHARIDMALEEMIADGRLNEARIRQFLQRIGPVEVEEAFRVLRHENFLLPPVDLHVCFTEFVALFFELRYFARPLLCRYFPGIEDLGRVESILREVIDAEQLFRSTRLAGAPDVIAHPVDVVDEPRDEPNGPLPVAPDTEFPSASKCGKRLAAADAAAARGNIVRSAILRLNAANVAPPEMIEATRQGALADIERLVTRLQAALELHDREVEEWRAALPALLVPASRGVWPQSARLLYDLQKVCVDYERDLYALDIVEWVCSFGRKSIKRAVPLQADVLLVKHLRSASARLGRAQISDEERRRLGILLRAAIHHCEDRLRDKIRPILSASLEEVGFQPENRAENVALRKIVEELLDRVTERGFLNMGDLRDAISRNQLKLPDACPKAMLLGDTLLKANRKLAITLDGVYHRGEIYLRWLQRVSSMLFGTAVGRWITLFLILPFGGAFATLVFAQEMLHLGGIKVQVRRAPSAPKNEPAVEPAKKAEPEPEFDPETDPDDPKFEPDLFEKSLSSKPESRPPPPPDTALAAAGASIVGLIGSPLGAGPLLAASTVLPGRIPDTESHSPGAHGLLIEVDRNAAYVTLAVLGVFYLLLLHVPPFRARTWEVTKTVWRGIRHVLFDAPLAFFALPGVRGFLDSPAMLFFRQRLFRPLVFALLAVLICLLFGVKGTSLDELIAGLGTFVVMFLLLNSRLGRQADEAATDWLARNWYWLRVGALPGLIGFIIYFFKEVMDRIERVIYTVDEALRFRPGDSRLALVYKPVLGLFWFLLTYVIRIILNLFIEPTVNPIKHFPAVTVGAKLIIPMIPVLGGAMTAAMEPFLGRPLAGAAAGTFIIMIPGIFGFAAWELKENWKLYRANRKKSLRPVVIGHHGETMQRFMRPGFHSGTIPKLFAKLRRAERRGDGRKLHKHHENLHHVAESIRHFVERELLLLLEQSRSWDGLELHASQVKLATNRVRIELSCPPLGETGLWLAFEERTGWLMAGVHNLGWLGKLTPSQLSAFRTALAGLYKLGGVTLVREQVEACVPGPYMVNGRGLIVYPEGDFTKEEVHPLQATNGEVPDVSGNGQARLPLDRLLYKSTPILWDDWVAAWEADREGKPPELPLLQQVRLLPVLAPSPEPVPVA